MAKTRYDFSAAVTRKNRPISSDGKSVGARSHGERGSASL